MISVILLTNMKTLFNKQDYTIENISDNNDWQQGQSLAYYIWKGESKGRGVNDYNRGSDKCRGSNRRNLQLTAMTVSTLKYYHSLPHCSKDVIFAAGWIQIIPNTFKYCQAIMRFDNNELFNAKLQNKIYVDCLTKHKQPSIYKYIISGEGLKEAARGVAREWASIGSPIHCMIKRVNKKGEFSGYRPWQQNGGCYNGYGINHHSIHPKYILQALQQARNNYVIMRNKGVGQNVAYGKSLGINDYE